MSKKRKHLVNKLRHKYRLIIYNDNTFEEVWYFRLSRLNVFSLGGMFIILFVGLITVLIAFTPLREYIPGYPDGNTRRNIILNVQKLDSLEHELAIRDRYFASLNNIIRGDVPQSFESGQDTTIRYQEIEFKRSLHDSILREQIEREEFFKLAIYDGSRKNLDFSSLYFYPPVKGLITNSFNPDLNHYGTDIVAPSNKVVVATLGGTVTMANWTLETGYVIQIQHQNNLVSIYKHNAELLKEVGNQVKPGEAIAIIGNSGELTSGPHLHFELWHNGVALNPEDYVDF